MPTNCGIVGCSSRLSDVEQGEKIRFFRIPSTINSQGKEDPLKRKRREAWLKAIGEGDILNRSLKNFKICSKHFHFGAPAPLKDIHHCDWVPSLLLTPWYEDEEEYDDFTWEDDREEFKDIRDELLNKVKERKIKKHKTFKDSQLVHSKDTNTDKSPILNNIRRTVIIRKNPRPPLKKKLLLSESPKENVIVSFNEQNIETTAEIAVLPSNDEDMILGI